MDMMQKAPFMIHPHVVQFNENPLANAPPPSHSVLWQTMFRAAVPTGVITAQRRLCPLPTSSFPLLFIYLFFSTQMSHFEDTMYSSSPQPLVDGRITETVREGRDRQSDEKGKMNLRERRGGGGSGGGGGYWRAGDKGSWRRRGHDRLGRSHKRVRPHCKQTIPLPLGCTLQINTHRFSFFTPLPFPEQTEPQSTPSANRQPQPGSHGDATAVTRPSS